METVIIDNLEWQKNEVSEMSWDKAVVFAARLGKYWRLPTIKELISLVEYKKVDPAINTELFPDCHSAYYWSSTTDASYTDYAWYVDFDDGYIDNGDKTHHYYVRCVREVKQ